MRNSLQYFAILLMSVAIAGCDNRPAAAPAPAPVTPPGGRVEVNTPGVHVDKAPNGAVNVEVGRQPPVTQP